jgi:hypothetical protein
MANAPDDVEDDYPLIPTAAPTAAATTISPMSQLLNSLGITRGELTRRSDQMRQFLTASEDAARPTTPTPAPRPRPSTSTSTTSSAHTPSTPAKPDFPDIPELQVCRLCAWVVLADAYARARHPVYSRTPPPLRALSALPPSSPLLVSSPLPTSPVPHVINLVSSPGPLLALARTTTPLHPPPSPLLHHKAPALLRRPRRARKSRRR